MTKFAVIVAGGEGKRMGAGVPKQFLSLRGQPVLHHTLQTFLQAFSDLRVILVLPTAHIEAGNQITSQLEGGSRVQIVAGGSTRFQSVQRGLQMVTEPSVVLVHDAVRCLVSCQLIQNCYAQALQKGSAIPVVAATDSMRIRTQEHHSVIDRSQVLIVQTPQTFLSQLIVPAFNCAEQPSFTDEATVVEAAGYPVHLIDGEYNNLKITRPVDLLIAETILQSQEPHLTRE